MDALRINEPFGNNFRSPRSDATAPFPLFRAKYRSCNSFLPELPHSIRRPFDHRNKHFYLTPREHEIVQFPRAIKRYSEYFSKICGTKEIDCYTL